MVPSCFRLHSLLARPSHQAVDRGAGQCNELIQDVEAQKARRPSEQYVLG